MMQPTRLRRHDEVGVFCWFACCGLAGGREGEGTNVIEAVLFQFDVDVTFASVGDKVAVILPNVALVEVALGKMVTSAAGTPVGEEGVGS